jgi:GTP-binding protein
VLDFASLGDGDLVALSAAHGLGIEALWERIETEVGAGEQDSEPGDVEPSDVEAAAAEEPFAPPRLALIGRPNVGKSSLLNRIAGFERSLVDAVPGTTRDAIDVTIARGERRYVVVDTAGLRRPSVVSGELEEHAVAASLHALSHAEIVLLVLDVTQGVTDQDLRLADLAWRRGRGLVVVVNKVDLAPALAAEQCHRVIAKRLPQWPPLPLVRVSATAGTGVKSLFTAVDTVARAYRLRIPTPRLNALLGQATAAHSPPARAGRPVKLLYATQVSRMPPHVVGFLSRDATIPAAYTRYLTHHLRDSLELVGVPLRLTLRARERQGRRTGPTRRSSTEAAAAGSGTRRPERRS